MVVVADAATLTWIATLLSTGVLKVGRSCVRECSGAGSTVRPVCGDCSQFFVCIANIPILRACPPGRLYDVSGKCLPAAQAVCSSGSLNPVTDALGNSPPPIQPFTSSILSLLWSQVELGWDLLFGGRGDDAGVLGSVVNGAVSWLLGPLFGPGGLLEGFNPFVILNPFDDQTSAQNSTVTNPTSTSATAAPIPTAATTVQTAAPTAATTTVAPTTAATAAPTTAATAAASAATTWSQYSAAPTAAGVPCLNSCVGIRSTGRYYPLCSTCSSYGACFFGGMVIHHCVVGQLFDLNLQQCAVRSTTCSKA